MLKFPLFALILSMASASFTQDDAAIRSYLNQHSQVIDFFAPQIHFDDTFYQNDVVFFGFVHGSEKPQLLDFELLHQLAGNGFRYYAAEVDYSLAFFFNEYLSSGDESYLDFACHQYRMRVPQDASIQFKDKWRRIQALNQSLPEKDKITVLGLDYAYSTDLTLTHIAYLSPEQNTGNALVDSLQEFKNLEMNEISIYSGKPAFKSGKGWDYFFRTEKGKYYERFVSEYQKDSTKILAAFGENAVHLRHLMNQSEARFREEVIFDNFNKLCVPLLEKSEKIYANFGYFHIQQDKINGSMPIAGLVKNAGYKTTSIVCMLSESECLKTSKLKRGEPFEIKGTTFRRSHYAGYSSSKFWDGDHLFEKVDGLKHLKKESGKNEVVLFQLNASRSPFYDSKLLAHFSRGGKKWQLEPNTSTTDYFQYVILVQNSATNVPLAEESVTN